MVPNPAIALKLDGLTCPPVRSTSYLIKDSLASSALEINSVIIIIEKSFSQVRT